MYRSSKSRPRPLNYLKRPPLLLKPTIRFESLGPCRRDSERKGPARKSGDRRLRKGPREQKPAWRDVASQTARPSQLQRKQQEQPAIWREMLTSPRAGHFLHSAGTRKGLRPRPASIGPARAPADEKRPSRLGGRYARRNNLLDGAAAAELTVGPACKSARGVGRGRWAREKAHADAAAGGS